MIDVHLVGAQNKSTGKLSLSEGLSRAVFTEEDADGKTFKITVKKAIRATIRARDGMLCSKQIL